MPGRVHDVRLPVAVLVAILVGGCLASPPAPAASDDPGPGDDERKARVGRGGDGGERDDHRNLTVLHEQASGRTQPGDYPLVLDVPSGGAQDVAWSIDTQGTPVPTLDGLVGHGCDWTGWGGSGVDNRLHGTCDDFAAGEIALVLHLSAPVLSYRLVVSGFVAGNATGNATV